jgi:hypothetical protein
MYLYLSTTRYNTYWADTTRVAPSFQLSPIASIANFVTLGTGCRTTVGADRVYPSGVAHEIQGKVKAGGRGGRGGGGGRYEKHLHVRKKEEGGGRNRQAGGGWRERQLTEAWTMAVSRAFAVTLRQHGWVDACSHLSTRRPLLVLSGPPRALAPDPEVHCARQILDMPALTLTFACFPPSGFVGRGRARKWARPGICGSETSPCRGFRTYVLLSTTLCWMCYTS